jgi:hypothetical protein
MRSAKPFAARRDGCTKRDLSQLRRTGRAGPKREVVLEFLGQQHDLRGGFRQVLTRRRARPAVNETATSRASVSTGGAGFSMSQMPRRYFSGLVAAPICRSSRKRATPPRVVQPT